MGGAACFTQENGEVLETRRERPLLGVLLLFAGMQVLPVMDGIAKLLSARYPLLAPCAYSEIIGAVAIGWWLFGDFPEAWTWAGICVVAASGIYITLRERRAPG